MRVQGPVEEVRRPDLKDRYDALLGALARQMSSLTSPSKPKQDAPPSPPSGPLNGGGSYSNGALQHLLGGDGQTVQALAFDGHDGPGSDGCSPFNSPDLQGDVAGGIRTVPGGTTSPQRSLSPRPRPAPSPSPLPTHSSRFGQRFGLVGTRSLPNGVGGRSACQSGSLTAALWDEAVTLPAAPVTLSYGHYMSASGTLIEVDVDGYVVLDRQPKETLQIQREGENVVLRHLGETNRGTYRLLTCEPSGVLVWDRESMRSQSSSSDDLDERRLSPDSRDGLVMWTPLQLESVDDADPPRGPTAPSTPAFGEGFAPAAAGRTISPRALPGETTPRRPPSGLPSAQAMAAAEAVLGMAAGSGWMASSPGDGGQVMHAASEPAPAVPAAIGRGGGGGDRRSSQLGMPMAAHGRPHSADLTTRDVAAAAAAQALKSSRERSRRSRTPSGTNVGGPTPVTETGTNGARRRAQSAVSVRPRLGVAAGGAGDAGIPAKAIDKNSLRLRNGTVFVEALHKWRAGNTRSQVTARKLLPGMCAVYVRKRPMFERDTRRCDFDVISVVGGSSVSGDGCPPFISQEIVHHSCIFDRSLVTPMITHTQFPFDGVFDVDATNEDIYHVVGRPLLENALAGNLATLFIFGQTGSGKTYTMRAIERMVAAELFDRLSLCDRDDSQQVAVNYFECAGRKALDLLSEHKSEIRLREEENGCFHPHDCQEVCARDAEELLSVMGEAAARRATDATAANSVSSRSHAVCRISLPGSARRGCLLLVDCAGTERSRDTLYFKGQHQKESAEINSSLFALKDCIRFRQAAIHRQGGLAQDGAPLRLPCVRATPLTKVLAESLISPSAQLAAIATVSPNATDAEVSLDTLRTVVALSGRTEARVGETRQAHD
eukprot:TRINITY_DN47612_c0_g2_i1.p1 TRINITY_DN47612_c0_g2~~TRINITY_DN47612_c0_g2_i1.p1  ORF type:complete len:953 (+),score=189.75 TRINITY_DN47612_c0_g2_i1:199-2859(+)